MNFINSNLLYFPFPQNYSCIFHKKMQDLYFNPAFSPLPKEVSPFCSPSAFPQISLLPLSARYTPAVGPPIIYQRADACFAALLAGTGETVPQFRLPGSALIRTPFLHPAFYVHIPHIPPNVRHFRNMYCWPFLSGSQTTPEPP